MNGIPCNDEDDNDVDGEHEGRHGNFRHFELVVLRHHCDEEDNVTQF